MPRFCICLIILRVRQAFEDVWGSKCTRVLNMARLYMQGLHRVLTVNEYGSICLINTWIYLNVPKCLWTYWILLNVPEYAWICLNKLFWLCQCPRYASSSQIFDKVFNMPQTLNVPGFWICCYIVIITLLL